MMWKDLFVLDENLSVEANAAMSAFSSSVYVNWFEFCMGYVVLSVLFVLCGIEDVIGECFICVFGGLCGEFRYGTFIDIASFVGARKIFYFWY